MKKSIIMLLALASSLAGATTTSFTELDTSQTVGDVVYTAPSSGSNLGAITGSGAWTVGYASNGNKTQFSSTVTLALDVDALSGVTSDTELMRIDTSNASISYSLFAVYDAENGVQLTIGYNDVVWNNAANQSFTLSSLSTYTGKEGQTLASLSYVLKPMNKADNSGGVRVYAAESDTPLISIPGMGTTSVAYNFNNILVHTDYVAAVSVTNAALSADEAQEVTAGVEAATQIPEPSAATLSLLALAGLAARRRRS